MAIELTNANGASSVRARTEEDLFALIAAHSDLTRADLQRLTGMSRSTINSAVGRLIADGRAVESSTQAKGPGSGSGRPALALSAVIPDSWVGAIDFGHNHVRAAIADAHGAIVGEDYRDTEVDLHAADAMDLAADMLASLRRAHAVAALDVVGAGIPGPIASRNGRVLSPTILSGWVDLAPADELEKRLGAPVVVDNDALLGALGEFRVGAGRDHTTFMYIKASHGIGGALVIDGQPYRGPHGLAGEIGHRRLPGRTELCRCGNRGCLEAAVSVDELLRQIAQSHPYGGAAPEELLAAPDTVTARILADAGYILGEAVAAYASLLDLTAVVVGGTLPATGPWFVDGVRAALARETPLITDSPVEVVPARLGVRSEIVGAVELASARVRSGL